LSEQGQADGESCPLSFGALELDFAAVQIHATSHDEKAEARSGNLPDIAAAMEGLEQTLLVGLGNAAAVVRHNANSLVAISFHEELHAFDRRRIFHGVRQ